MDGKKSCNIVWPTGNTGSGNSTADDEEFIESDGSTFTLYTFTLGFAIPLSLILIFYYLVLRKLRTVGPKSKSKEKKRSHRKVTKLVLTVIAVYVLCWTPYWASIRISFILLFLQLLEGFHLFLRRHEFCRKTVDAKEKIGSPVETENISNRNLTESEMAEEFYGTFEWKYFIHFLHQQYW